MIHSRRTITALVLLLSTASLQAQYSTHHPWWVNMGGGGAFIGSDFTMTAGVIYSQEYETTIVSARIIGLTNENPTVKEIHPSSTTYKFSDYGVMYGPIWHRNNAYLALTGGVGFVRTAYQRPAGNTTATAFNIPIEAQFGYRLNQNVGVGIYPYASINTEKSYFGLLLCAQLGVW